jgi:hypothetical protein
MAQHDLGRHEVHEWGGAVRMTAAAHEFWNRIPAARQRKKFPGAAAISNTAGLVIPAIPPMTLLPVRKVA